MRVRTVTHVVTFQDLRVQCALKDYCSNVIDHYALLETITNVFAEKKSAFIALGFDWSKPA